MKKGKEFCIIVIFTQTEIDIMFLNKYVIPSKYFRVKKEGSVNIRKQIISYFNATILEYIEGNNLVEMLSLDFLDRSIFGCKFSANSFIKRIYFSLSILINQSTPILLFSLLSLFIM